MERSSRFISLSGLSGVSAGVFALAGAYFAYDWIYAYYVRYNNRPGYSNIDFTNLKWNLVGLGMVVLCGALASAFYFTWRRARRNHLPMWDHSSRKLIVNLVIPLAAGGVFVLGLLYHNNWQFVAPACLIFYGLALVNASKYTLSEIRYVGLLEIILGLVNMWYVGYGLHFWAAGFGILHIIYGLVMWWKYEKQS